MDLPLSLAQSKRYAKLAGLTYHVPSQEKSSLKSLGITRVRHGKSFFYRAPSGNKVRDAKTLERIRKLAIPPAYENVWIAQSANAHLQVIGQDARGRKQYRYHPKWLAIKAKSKYDRMLDFAKVLPEIRKVTHRHLSHRHLNREKVLAAVVRLLEKTLIRIGNDEYAKSNHSYGLSTLKHEHVHFESGKIIFRFRGKSKIQHQVELKDAMLAKVIEACRKLKGKELFQYESDDGRFRRIHAQDVNHYLRSISGTPVTAKDFRTWGATLHAASIFHQSSLPLGKTKVNRAINEVIDQVARKLGNTRSICRKSYIHPSIVDAFTGKKAVLRDPITDLEGQVSRFLKAHRLD